MTIYIKPRKYHSSYIVATGVPIEGEVYNTKVIAWFKTMEEAIDYAKYLILHHPVGSYDQIVFGREEK